MHMKIWKFLDICIILMKFQEKQTNFVNAICKGSSDDRNLQIVIIWRRDASHIKFEWIEGAKLENEENMPEEKIVNDTKAKIDMAIQRLLKTSEALSSEAFVQNLLDEHAQGVIAKFFTKMFYFAEHVIDSIEQEHILATLSLLGTIAFMFAVGYIMVYFVRAEEETLKAKGQLNKNNSKLYLLLTYF